MHRLLATIAVIAASIWGGYLAACPAPLAGDVPLPKPDTQGGMPLNAALFQRRSVKAFDPGEVTLAQIGQLCWSAQGITSPQKGLRTAPSAMAMYAVGVYIVDARGTHEYIPKDHTLRLIKAGTQAELRAAMGGATSVATAPVSMVLVLRPEVFAGGAGGRAERFALLEAGHVAQNVLLSAVCQGLGSVPVGGIDGPKLAAAIGLKAPADAAYVLPVGVPPAR